MWFGNCKGIPQINTQGRCQYRQIMILTPLLIIEKRFNRFYLLYKFLWRGPVQVRRLYVCGRLSLGITFLYIARPPPLQSEARCFLGFPFFIIPNSFAAAEDPMPRTETLELAKDYYRINDRNLAIRFKQCIHEAAKTMYNQKMTMNHGENFGNG